jgi:CBS domain-containing protein
MAQRHTDNGRDVTARPSPPNGTHLEDRERERRAAESPPGSRERSESDVTGWSPERDEPPEVRQGRFHRAAQLRMAQPRTGEGGLQPEDDTRDDLGTQRRLMGRDRPYTRPERGDTEGGHYGRDDRAVDDAAGLGPGPLMGDQDLYHSLEGHQPPREYREWDRTGTGAERSSHTTQTRSPGHGGQATRGVPPADERGVFGRGQRPERSWEDRPTEGREAGGEGYSSLVGMRQPAPSRESRVTTHGPTGAPTQQQPQGRWKREPLMAREIMTRGVKSVHLDSSLREVARVMKDEDCGIVPVVDERGRLKGVLTDRDLVIRTLAEGRPPDNMRVRDVMTDDVDAVTPDEDIHGIITLMGRRQVRRVPVVERDDRLVGIISMADIATRADYDEELQQALDRISARRSFWSRLY